MTRLDGTKNQAGCFVSRRSIVTCGLAFAVAASAFLVVAPPAAAVVPTQPTTTQPTTSPSRISPADHAIVQAMIRLPESERGRHRQHGDAIGRYLVQIGRTDPAAFVNALDGLGRQTIDTIKDSAVRQTLLDQLTDAAASDDPVAVRGASWLVRLGGIEGLDDAAESFDDSEASDSARKRWLTSLGAAKIPEVTGWLHDRLHDDGETNDDDVSIRKHDLVRAIARTRPGQRRLLRDVESRRFDASLGYEYANALLGSKDDEIRTRAAATGSLRLPATKSAEPLPPVQQLVARRGDAAAGAVVFAGTGTCSKCHQVGDAGKNVGPNLSEIGDKLAIEDMYNAILDPSAAISHNYESYSALTLDGVVVTGLMITQNDDAVVLRSADGTDVTIRQDDLETLRKSEVSLMPANLQAGMSTDDLVNLVAYLMSLKKHSGANDRSADVPATPPSRDAVDAVASMDVADDVTVKLFAHEPMMYSPTAIDVDHRGRVWVCEAVNYRHFRNPDNPPRTEGDRILILQDRDGDAVAEHATVFYQGPEIDSPHGVCHLGDRVIVSAGSNVWVFFDDDGDDRADRKEAMFTGISGVQHDHGIHTFMPGPDGKLYFNFGNEGGQLLDADGKPVVDLAGNVVDSSRNPYQQGMVFRCDVDGSNVETLGWNFRNNWEVAVDSFGAMWQSDNDDDGNRGTRINFVVEYGNYGYRDAKTGDSWRTPRINLESEVPLQHWHLNDPGVIPNVLQTGAGSPTGMAIYEGSLLPSRFRGAPMHCDPGVNVVRSYIPTAEGAGYTATIDNLIRGEGDRWFRPVDVVTAGDGSVIVADWYDPGVGGHRMGDIERGRLFRMSTDEKPRYEINVPKFDAIEASLDALSNPNRATQYLAFVALRDFYRQSPPDVADLLKVNDPIIRARRMWLLSKVPATAHAAIDAAIADDHPDMRMAGIRAARQCATYDRLAMIDAMADDDSAGVRRELLVALRESDWSNPRTSKLWLRLADHYHGDRWYLETLGIAADGHWDVVLPEWIESIGGSVSEREHHDILWRSAVSESADRIAELIRQSDSAETQKRYFRALELGDDESARQAFIGLLESSP